MKLLLFKYINNLRGFKPNPATMKAQIKFIRLDNEPALPEEELVFEVIPNSGDGVSAKTRWFLRVAKCFVDSRAGHSENLVEQIKFSKELINDVMGINDKNE